MHGKLPSACVDFSRAGAHADRSVSVDSCGHLCQTPGAWAQLGPSQGARAVAGQVTQGLCSLRPPQTDAIARSEWQNGIQAPVREMDFGWKT